ncbi:DnaJ domain-containing protein [Salinarimonas soli]|uniref:DnaJ domain-containing protein n=1 Tax=Salinarimonas soli TaxID=1638099 RepID=A0A5B2V8L9_9HYPH|nr:DnaJ domain-containing protein [Salinarimonas soli]KAA2235146.1 DnaJ domain-containing protein [Salinarimonas soli]
MSLLYGLAALAVIWWVSKFFAGANPAVLARTAKRVGGVAALGLAALLLVRGRIDMALLVGGAGGWLLGWGWMPFPRLGQSPRSTPSSGAVSRVRSAMIEMELDHDTGHMSGSVLAGAHAGRRLGDLPEPALKALLAECAARDPDGLRLLEAYLDRRFPGWRVDADRDHDAGPGAQAKPGAMTEEEAYQILGLEPGAPPEEIRRAHRTLMMKLHPDQGGTTYLAARVNGAKEILLSRHR